MTQEQTESVPKMVLGGGLAIVVGAMAMLAMIVSYLNSPVAPESLNEHAAKSVCHKQFILDKIKRDSGPVVKLDIFRMWNHCRSKAAQTERRRAFELQREAVSKDI